MVILMKLNIGYFLIKKKKDNKNFDFSSIELILIKLRIKKIIKKIFGRVVQW